MEYTIHLGEDTLKQLDEIVNGGGSEGGGEGGGSSDFSIVKLTMVNNTADVINIPTDSFGFGWYSCIKSGDHIECIPTNEGWNLHSDDTALFINILSSQGNGVMIPSTITQPVAEGDITTQVISQGTVYNVSGEGTLTFK
jgi:hypothetical protein